MTDFDLSKCFKVIVVLCVVSAISLIYAQDVLKTEEVIVEGVGVSAEAAKKNAFRNAVGKVVGSFIENDTLIKNDKIIEEKLLEYSGGFVETFEIVSEGKDKDGFFKVKLKAKVAKQTVAEKLRLMKIDVKTVSGSNLKAQLETQETMKKDGGKLINSIMEEYPKLWQAKQIGEPKIANRKLVLQIEISVDREKYLAWAEKLCNVLEKSADLKVTRAYSKSGEENNGRPIEAKLENDNSIAFYAEKVNRYDPDPKELPDNKGRLFAVVRNFSVSGDCVIDNFYFNESNSIFPVFDAAKKNKLKDTNQEPSFHYGEQFIPNQFNILISSGNNEILKRWKFKTDYSPGDWRYGLWTHGGNDISFATHKNGGNNGIEPLTPFPFIYGVNGFHRGQWGASYSTKCKVDVRLLIDDFDVAKVSKIATGFSIEK